MAALLVETAFAKVNLFLHVTRRQDDGYHGLETLYAFAEFGDALSVELADSTSMNITGPQARNLSAGPDNLVCRAVEMLSDLSGQKLNARIDLEKNIPVGAGLGGGSADAGAVMRALVQLYDLELPTDLLRSRAMALGADIPACYASKPAIGRGRGERLQPIEFFGCPVLLVNPGIEISTARAFRAFDDSGQAFTAPGQNIGAIDTMSDLIELLGACSNDLQSVAIAMVPEIGVVLDRLKDDKHCLFAQMSGSGATCFGLFETMELAETAAAAISRDKPDWWVVATTLMSPSAELHGE